MPADLQSDLLSAQLRQAQAALETARRLQHAAEEQRREAVEQLKAVAAALLAPEWNTLKARDETNADRWSPGQLGGWIVETGTAKLNRLELLAGGETTAALEACARERDALRSEATRLAQEVKRLTAELEVARTQAETQGQELRQLRGESVNLRRRVAELAAPAIQPALPEPGEQSASPTAEVRGEDGEWLARWQASTGYPRDVEALRVIGVQGLALRESVARAMGLTPASGSTAAFFRQLRDQGLIEESPARSEVAGRPPNVLRLTERGQAAFRAVFGIAPVEPETERLLRRHKSEEQVMLALQARLALEEAGAEMVDLFPDPAPLPGGGTFEIDLVAVVGGQKVYAECERAAGHRQRLDKWSRYARLTRDFCFFVPNKEAMTRLMNELGLWAYRRLPDAAGVTVHVCQLTEVGEGRELWQVIRPLGGRGE